MIELLAVIIILGILMIIAIPSVTKYINDSKNLIIDGIWNIGFCDSQIAANDAYYALKL